MQYLLEERNQAGRLRGGPLLLGTVAVRSRLALILTPRREPRTRLLSSIAIFLQKLGSRGLVLVVVGLRAVYLNQRGEDAFACISKYERKYLVAPILLSIFRSQTLTGHFADDQQVLTGLCTTKSAFFKSLDV